MKFAPIISILLLSFSFSNDIYCNASNLNQDGIKVDLSRNYYNIGDTISDEDQQHQYSVCYGDGSYDAGSTFRFADYANEIMLISMNATW